MLYHASAPSSAVLQLVEWLQHTAMLHVPTPLLLLLLPPSSHTYMLHAPAYPLLLLSLCHQVARWAKQYHASVPQPSPAVLHLVEWLQHNVPAEDAAPGQPALLHGDYRLDNLVFDEGLQVSDRVCGGCVAGDG
jgi:hypothetical protein